MALTSTRLPPAIPLGSLKRSVPQNVEERSSARSDVREGAVWEGGATWSATHSRPTDVSTHVVSRGNSNFRKEWGHGKS